MFLDAEHYIADGKFGIKGTRLKKSGMVKFYINDCLHSQKRYDCHSRRKFQIEEFIYKLSKTKALGHYIIVPD